MCVLTWVHNNFHCFFLLLFFCLRLCVISEIDDSGAKETVHDRDSNGEGSDSDRVMLGL